jgi:hypothetical protein
MNEGFTNSRALSFPPPKDRASWFAVLSRAGFDQRQMRQAYGKLPATLEPDGDLDPEDFSTLHATGQFPTFSQTMMDGLERAAKQDGESFTEEDRPAGEWCLIFALETKPPKKLTGQTFFNRRTGKTGRRIRAIETSSRRYKIHRDDLPSGTKSEPQRNDIIKNASS